MVEPGLHELPHAGQDRVPVCRQRREHHGLHVPIVELDHADSVSLWERERGGLEGAHHRVDTASAVGQRRLRHAVCEVQDEHDLEPEVLGGMHEEAGLAVVDLLPVIV